MNTLLTCPKCRALVSLHELRDGHFIAAEAPGFLRHCRGAPDVALSLAVRPAHALDGDAAVRMDRRAA